MILSVSSLGSIADMSPIRVCGANCLCQLNYRVCDCGKHTTAARYIRSVISESGTGDGWTESSRRIGYKYTEDTLRSKDERLYHNGRSRKYGQPILGRYWSGIYQFRGLEARWGTGRQAKYRVDGGPKIDRVDMFGSS